MSSFWDALQLGCTPLDRRAILTPDGDQFRLSGTKSFCSGSKDSDILPITATHQITGELFILAIPTQRDGITIHDDWHNIGQRQTDSGSITFDQVVVYSQEIFGNRTGNSQPFSSFRALMNYPAASGRGISIKKEQAAHLCGA